MAAVTKTKPATDLPEGRLPAYTTPPSVQDVFGTPPTPEEMAESVRLRAEQDTNDRLLNDQIAQQAADAGYDLESWRLIVLQAPTLAGQIMQQRAKQQQEHGGYADDVASVKAMDLAGGRHNERDIETMAHRLLPESKRAKFTVLADPPGADGVRRNYSIVQKVNVPKKLQSGYSINLADVQLITKSLRCSMRSATGARCEGRFSEPYQLVTHERVHHANEWAAKEQARLREEEELRRADEKTRRDREDATLALLTQLGERLAAPAVDPALAEALKMVAESLKKD